MMPPFIVKFQNWQNNTVWSLMIYSIAALCMKHYSLYCLPNIPLIWSMMWPPSYSKVLPNLRHSTVKYVTIIMRPTRISVHLWCCGWGDAARSGRDRGNSPDPEGWPDERQTDRHRWDTTWVKPRLFLAFMWRGIETENALHKNSTLSLDNLHDITLNYLPFCNRYKWWCSQLDSDVRATNIIIWNYCSNINLSG